MLRFNMLLQTTCLARAGISHMHQSSCTCTIHLSKISSSLVRRTAKAQALFKLKHWAERGHSLAGNLQLLSFIQLHRATIKHVDSDGLHSQLHQMV